MIGMLWICALFVLVLALCSSLFDDPPNEYELWQQERRKEQRLAFYAATRRLLGRVFRYVFRLG